MSDDMPDADVVDTVDVPGSEVVDPQDDEDYHEDDEMDDGDEGDEEVEEVDEDDEGDEGEETREISEIPVEEQPVKRKRGRPPGSGKKKPIKTGRFQPLQIPLDDEGKPFVIENDELVLPEDPAGEEKIDKLGVLKGGREFRLRTFSIFGRGQRQYMLATEPARCIGFRDSYLLFQRHRKLLKIKLTDDEKFDMIDRELIPHSYKGRTLGVLTARSVFREFGARVIVGGRRVRDDYNEAAAVAAGHTSDELADPEDFVPAGGQNYDKNQYVAWYSGPPQVDAVSLYESNLKNVLQAAGGQPLSLPHITQGPLPADAPVDPSLVTRACVGAADFNSELGAGRKRQWQTQIIDPQTSVRFVPLASQPQKSRVTKLGPSRGVTVTTKLRWVPRVANLPGPEVWEGVSDAVRDAIEEEREKYARQCT